MKTLKVLVVGGLLSLALIQVGFAGNGEHCGHHGKHAMHHPEGPMKHKHNPMHLLSKLDLSEQQDQQIKQIFEDEKPNMRAKHEAKIALMKQLHEVVSQEKFNEQQAEVLASKMGELAKEAALQKAKTGSKVYAILTPAQQEKFNHLIEEKMQKRPTLKTPANHLGVNQADSAGRLQQI